MFYQHTFLYFTENKLGPFIKKKGETQLLQEQCFQYFCKVSGVAPCIIRCNTWVYIEFQQKKVKKIMFRYVPHSLRELIIHLRELYTIRKVSYIQDGVLYIIPIKD